MTTGPLYIRLFAKYLRNLEVNGRHDRIRFRIVTTTYEPLILTRRSLILTTIINPADPKSWPDVPWSWWRSLILNSKSPYQNFGLNPKSLISKNPRLMNIPLDDWTQSYKILTLVKNFEFFLRKIFTIFFSKLAKKVKFWSLWFDVSHRSRKYILLLFGFRVKVKKILDFDILASNIFTNLVFVRLQRDSKSKY